MRPSRAIAPGDCALVNPQIFFNARACGALVGDSGMTQPGACRSAAGPKRDARADAPEVERTVGSDRLPAAPLSSKNFRGPEVLRPRLTAGLPLSAFGPKAAVPLIRVGPTPSGCPAVVPPSRSHHRPVRREPSIDTRTTGTSANLSHIADITRRTRVSPAMISSLSETCRRNLADASPTHVTCDASKVHSKKFEWLDAWMLPAWRVCRSKRRRCGRRLR